MIYALIVILIVIGYLIYTKLDKLLWYSQTTHNNKGGSDNNTADKWLKNINTNIYQVNEKLTSINAALNHSNPAGYGSVVFKSRENLIKVYSDFLVEKDNISEPEARIRARYEVYEFGDEKITEAINTGLFDGVFWVERRKAEEEFRKSGILEKDAASYWDLEVDGKKKITPYYLASALYDIYVDQNAKAGDFIYENDSVAYMDDYRDLVKQKAIILNLEKLGVIKKTNRKTVTGNNMYQVVPESFGDVKQIVYGGEASHEDDYFEEQSLKTSYKRVFYLQQF